MANRKTKTVKIQLLFKGERVDYEDILLSTIGGAISQLSCLNKEDIRGDYFVPDCDYELIVRPRKR